MHIQPGTVAPTLNHIAYWLDKSKFLLYEDQYVDWTLFLVDNGSFQYEICGGKGTASFGDIVFCPPRTPFRRVVITPLSFYFIRVSWHAPASSAPLSLLPKGPIPDELLPLGKISLPQTERLTSNYAALRQAMSLYEPERTLRVNHLLQDIWLLYVDAYAPPDRRTDAVELISADRQMLEAHTLIRQHAYDTIHLQDIADRLKLSSVQLTRKFKQTYGITPLHYLTMVRLEKAKQLLLETTLTIDQISECCGYQSGFSLSRVFARHERIPPSRYRSLHRM